MTAQLLSIVVAFLFLSVMYLFYKIQQLTKTLSAYITYVVVQNILIDTIIKNLPQPPVKSDVQEFLESKPIQK